MLLIVKVLTKYYSDRSIKKNEMGRACSTYEEDDKYIQGLVWVTLGNRLLGCPRHR